LKLKKEKVVKILTELMSILPNGDLSISELANKIGISSGTVYRYVGIMEAKGTIKQSRIVQNAPLYQITEEGKKYLEEINSNSQNKQ